MQPADRPEEEKDKAHEDLRKVADKKKHKAPYYIAVVVSPSV